MSEWYHARGGRQQGPFGLEQMRALVRGGQLAPEDLVWRQGLPDWLPLREVPELAAFAGGAAATTGEAATSEAHGNPYSPPASLAAAGGEAPARRLDLGRAISTGWAAFRHSIGFGLLSLLALIVVSVGAAVLDLALEVQIFAFVLGVLVGTPLQAGGLLGAIRACRGQTPELGTLVEPFRTSYLPLVAIALVTNLVSLGVLALGGLLLVGGAVSEIDPRAVFTVAIVGLALILWLWIRLYFVVAAVAERRLGPIAGLIASWRMTGGNVLLLIVLFIVGLLVLCAGALLLLVGIIPAGWLFVCLAAAAYDQLSPRP